MLYNVKIKRLFVHLCKSLCHRITQSKQKTDNDPSNIPSRFRLEISILNSLCLFKDVPLCINSVICDIKEKYTAASAMVDLAFLGTGLYDLHPICFA